MRILITGGTGFIGLATAKALRERGHEVRLLSSRPRSTLDGFSVVQGDVRAPDSLKDATDGIEAAVIGHQFPGFPIERPQTHNTFAEVDAEGTRHILDALTAHGQPKRVIYLSGAAVQDNLAGQHPGIDAKLAAEGHTQTCGIPWTILRPSIVYGPGDHYFSTLAQFIQSGPVVPVFGNGRALAAPVHVDDLAQAITLALDNPQAENGLFDACGPDILSALAVLDTLMAALGQRRPVLPLPLGLINGIASVLEHLPHPPLTRGLIAFSQFDNTSHGTNIDSVIDIKLRGCDAGIRQVYAKEAKQ